MGVYIHSDGFFSFVRDTIKVPEQIDEVIEGGLGILNDGGGLRLENSTINDERLPAFNGIAHYFYGANYLTINNSEIYTCRDTFYKDEPPTPLPFPCFTVQVIPYTSPTIPVAKIGSTLLFGGHAIPPNPVTQCISVHDEVYNGFGWPTMGDSGGDTIFASPVCP